MPMDIQLKALHEIPALRDAKIYRPGYAIEYDYFDPTQLKHSLESKIIKGLVLCRTGERNDRLRRSRRSRHRCRNQRRTSLRGRQDVRDASETKVTSAYSSMTSPQREWMNHTVCSPQEPNTASCSVRTMPTPDSQKKHTNWELPNVTDYDWWMEKKEAIERIIEFCANYPIKKDEINPKLEALGTTPLRAGCKLIDLVARPHLNLAELVGNYPRLEGSDGCTSQSQRRDRRSGRNQNEVQRIHRPRETHRRQDAPTGEYQNQGTLQLLRELHEISTEGRQKLERIDPETLAQASRIPGVSPSDINVMLVLLGR